MQDNISRREFLALLSASVVSLGTGVNQEQLLDYLADKTPLAKPVIYLDVDSMAFFDVPYKTYSKAKTIKISELMKKEPVHMHWPIKQKVSMYLPPESVYYFSTKPEDDVKTTTILGQCIVFGAYTTYPNGIIKSSGVYHAKTLPPDKKFEKSIKFFIDTLRSNPNQMIFLRGKGHYGFGGNDELVKNLETVLRKNNLIIKNNYLDLGETVGRISNFYPATGKQADEVFLAKREYIEKKE
ncbi:MAG TPA: hypothetical protein VJ461_04600 [Candidatus Nanoarchaeia archaeon]|nr:hypothetical protein [Candidatus Nanoarchaeia archaeon]